jgi:hypothetical protein
MHYNLLMVPDRDQLVVLFTADPYVVVLGTVAVVGDRHARYVGGRHRFRCAGRDVHLLCVSSRRAAVRLPSTVMLLRTTLVVLLGAFSVLGCTAEPSFSNQVVGTWRMVSAKTERSGVTSPAYGERPNGMLSFTPDMRFVEVLTDSSVPLFASEVRGEGTDEENRAAIAGSIGMFGTYTVDANGQFSGNRVEGATFPNWVGDVRTTDDLRIIVDGDRMTEHFTRPDGTRISIVFERVR